ncbi:MAG: hypothetical protein KGH79_04910, partial [Patescibacteria group bacterium]|nr:hypothetical protein [Patescibacteria group bacterium]
MADSTNNKQQGGGKKPPRRGRMPQLPKMPQGDSFWVNLATSIVLLLLLAGAYTYFVGTNKPQVQSIPISQVAQDIEAG